MYYGTGIITVGVMELVEVLRVALLDLVPPHYMDMCSGST